MTAIVVDDEQLAMEGCISAIQKVNPNIKVQGFSRGKDAVAYVAESGADIAFLDVEMRIMGGIELAQKLQSINPKINIIFVTGYSEYMGEAFSLYASGYIMKPVTTKKIKSELEHLRFPVTEEISHKLKVVTFGNFEIFDPSGRPIAFSYNKSKELLAFLIDANGAMRTFEQVMEALWMDEDGAGSHGSYLRNIVADLQHTLSQYGCGEAIIRRRGEAGVDKSYFDCDFFDYLEGKQSESVFSGSYMSQYSWDEKTLGMLYRMDFSDV